jgi:long-chain acyl-CoA synthetase
VLSYLPLSHIFEQQAEALFFGCGGRIGYFSGDIKLLLDDLTALKPTVFIGVPRVYARFQERISQSVESASIIQRTLFNWAYERQLRAEQNPVGPRKVARSGIWDALVFKKVRGKLLPNCRLAITGSAPMSAQTNDFLKVCLQCAVVQGYGLTETVGGMNCSPPGGSTSGTCGGPLPGVYVKLVDVPDMGYLSSDTPHPRGEICVKGSIVTNGYYKNEAATAEAFDSEGYFMTGDIAHWLPDGSLQIIDRKKNLFKLAQGEYVSPENLEQEYNKCKLVGQIFVYGNSLESTLLAVVVPDIPSAKAWAAENTKGETDIVAIAALPEFKKAVLAELAEMCVTSKFKRYEEIKDAVIEATDLNNMGQGFHVDNDLMTPSFKLKRPQLSKKYKGALEALYAAKKSK